MLYAIAASRGEKRKQKWDSLITLALIPW